MGSISNLGDRTLTGFSDSRVSGSGSRVQPAPALEDQIQIAKIPPTTQLEELQTTNPSSFQAVVTDAILQLRAAAFQTTDPNEAAYISGLADRFQELEENSRAQGTSA